MRQADSFLKRTRRVHFSRASTATSRQACSMRLLTATRRWGISWWTSEVTELKDGRCLPRPRRAIAQRPATTNEPLSHWDSWHAYDETLLRILCDAKPFGGRRRCAPCNTTT